MIKQGLIILLIVVSTITVFAQRGMSAKEFAKQETRLLKDEIIDLTEIQTERIYNVNLKYANKIQEYKKSASREQVFEIRDRLKKQKNTDIKKILTNEQYNKYIEFTSKQTERRKR